MLPVDIPLAFALGIVLALAAGRALWFEPPAVTARPFVIAFLWLVFVFFPANRSFYFGYPDWQWMYFLRASDVHFGWMFVYDVGFFAAFAFGFRLGHEGVRTGRRLLAFLPAGAVLASIAAFFWMHRDRLARVGTYDEFRAGTARTVAATGLLPWFALAGVLVAGSLVLAVREMRKPGPV